MEESPHHSARRGCGQPCGQPPGAPPPGGWLRDKYKHCQMKNNERCSYNMLKEDAPKHNPCCTALDGEVADTTALVARPGLTWPPLKSGDTNAVRLTGSTVVPEISAPLWPASLWLAAPATHMLDISVQVQEATKQASFLHHGAPESSNYSRAPMHIAGQESTEKCEDTYRCRRSPWGRRCRWSGPPPARSSSFHHSTIDKTETWNLDCWGHRHAYPNSLQPTEASHGFTQPEEAPRFRMPDCT